MVNFIWQHNVPVESYGRLLKGQKMTPPPASLTLVTPKLKVKELSQSGF